MLGALRCFAVIHVAVHGCASRSSTDIDLMCAFAVRHMHVCECVGSNVFDAYRNVLKQLNQKHDQYDSLIQFAEPKASGVTDLGLRFPRPSNSVVRSFINIIH